QAVPHVFTYPRCPKINGVREKRKKIPPIVVLSEVERRRWTENPGVTPGKKDGTAGGSFLMD
ncbi:hypothetical protein COS54_00125, partial [Candidatus Shapirobacteria bacterium CG03_land_8_20_14_0_80_39_12]